MKLSLFILITILGLQFSQNLHAEEEASAKEKSLWEKTKEFGKEALETTKNSAEKVNQSIQSAPEQRATKPQSVIGSYSPLDLWIPSKLGVSYSSYNAETLRAWEIEYVRGSFAVPFIIEDLGSITDQRLTLMRRSYGKRNSFNFHYGINYSSFKVELGNVYLNAISGGASQYSLFQVETLGLTWGVGNRWQFKNRVILGVDWFTINLPLFTIESDAAYLKSNAPESKKEDIRDALDFFEDFPTMSLLKLQAGYSF